MFKLNHVILEYLYSNYAAEAELPVECKGI